MKVDTKVIGFLVVMFLVIIGISTFLFYKLKKDNYFEAHIKSIKKKDDDALRSVQCDYVSTINIADKVLWKSCHNGYDRYFIPFTSWFKNRKTNQSLEERNLCIRKAFENIDKMHDGRFSIDYYGQNVPSDHKDFKWDLWFSVECEDPNIEFV